MIVASRHLEPFPGLRWQNRSGRGRPTPGRENVPTLAELSGVIATPTIQSAVRRQRQIMAIAAQNHGKGCCENSTREGDQESERHQSSEATQLLVWSGQGDDGTCGKHRGSIIVQWKGVNIEQRKEQRWCESLQRSGEEFLEDLINTRVL